MNKAMRWAAEGVALSLGFGALPGCTSEPRADDSVDAGLADAGAVDGAPSPEAGDATDGSVCDRESPVSKRGCLELPMAPMLTIGGLATPVASYTCRADNADALVRIRACVSPPSDACVADAGETLCAVVDIPATALVSFPPDGTTRLDGTAAFTFVTRGDYEVKPENVVYTPAQANVVTRVWLESTCFCTPGASLTGSQTVVGSLMITSATAQRVGGRITLAASGHISPVNYRERQIEIDTFFDVAITAPAAPASR